MAVSSSNPFIPLSVAFLFAERQYRPLYVSPQWVCRIGPEVAAGRGRALIPLPPSPDRAGEGGSNVDERFRVAVRRVFMSSLPRFGAAHQPFSDTRGSASIAGCDFAIEHEGAEALLDHANPWPWLAFEHRHEVIAGERAFRP